MAVAVRRLSAVGMGADEPGFEIGSSEEILVRGSQVRPNPLVTL